MKARPMRPAPMLSFYLGRLVAAPSGPDSRRVRGPRTCGINKDNAVWNNNSQFCPIENTKRKEDERLEMHLSCSSDD